MGEQAVSLLGQAQGTGWKSTFTYLSRRLPNLLLSKPNILPASKQLLGELTSPARASAPIFIALASWVSCHACKSANTGHCGFSWEAGRPAGRTPLC